MDRQEFNRAFRTARITLAVFTSGMDGKGRYAHISGQERANAEDRWIRMTNTDHPDRPAYLALALRQNGERKSLAASAVFDTVKCRGKLKGWYRDLATKNLTRRGRLTPTRGCLLP